MVLAGRLYVFMAEVAASTELLQRATIWSRCWPDGQVKQGRWAVEAHDVFAEAERPMMPTRTGFGDVVIVFFFILPFDVSFLKLREV